mmetsp:Transcript_34857/g.53522  ORF Transcript_34857/g.53522 Transcript_34857/m.53522 type:complete len:168 (+) Transcript_34857:1371-1874(+)
MSIPDKIEVSSYNLYWLGTDAAERPFSKQSLEFIRNIDIMVDIKRLDQTFKFRPECLRNMRISSLLLKMGAEKGLTLSQIGSILCRPDEDDEQPSILEKIVENARKITDMKKHIANQQREKSLNLIPRRDFGDSQSKPRFASRASELQRSWEKHDKSDLLPEVPEFD